MEKFHYFLCGKEFTVETDQKPLVSIYKKHIVDISPRVQRLINSQIISIPAFPCCLQERKRHSSCRCTQSSNSNGPRGQHPVTHHCCQHNHCRHLNECTSSGYFFQEVRLIEEEYSARQSTHKLSHYINTGFPCDKKNLLTDLQEFWNHREALSIKSGLITCGNRIIVPKEMRAEMLQYIHEGHQGKERCLLWARNTIFWPKIMYDIQELIERCIICQEHGKSQSIIGTTQELPPFPWHTLATDIFYWKRMNFLIVADIFSKYFLVRKLANSTSAAVCAEIVTILTELGLPHIIRSDNGLCYNSKEFQQLLQCYNITHHTSSPHHPRSNGFVERTVGVAKKLMDKAGSEGKPWISGLYEYRVTPQSGSIASPLQLITQRTPQEKDLPQLPSPLGAQEMYETHQKAAEQAREKLH